MQAITRAQREALYKVWQRDGKPAKIYQGSYGKPSYRAFRKSAFYSSLMGCLMVPWCGMVLGIESDGYTHS